MSHLKILLASEENMIREPLKKYFSAWGMETVECNKTPEISTLKAFSPQLVFMDKKYYGNCDFLSGSTNQQFENIKKPGIVIVVKPTDKMPLMSEVGQNSILQIPYSASTLFDTVKQALCFSQMESSFAAVSAKLDLIYDLLINNLRPSEKSWDEALVLPSESKRSLENRQSIDDKDEVISKSKALILSLLKDIKSNGEFQKYEGKLHLLEKYLSELLEHEYIHEHHDPEPVTDLLKNNPLSRKELKIFSMITKSMTTEEIADRLFISPETVKSHRRNIRKKLSLVGSKSSLGDFIHDLNDNDKNVSVEPDTVNPSKTQKVFNHC